MVTMRDMFEAIEEGYADRLRNELRRSTGRTKSKKVGDDKWEFKGKTGHWRTVNGHEIFFPDDGGDPMGMPKAMKAAQRKDTSPEGLRRELIAQRKKGKR